MSLESKRASEQESVYPSFSHINYLPPILGGGALIITVIVALTVWAIIQGRLSAHQSAEVATANLSRILADNLTSTIEKIDFGIRGVLDEYDSQQLSGHLDEKKILQTIARQDSRNPDALGFRIFGTDGHLRYGVSNISSRDPNLSEREDFKYLRDTRDPGLLVSPPVFGTAAQQWIIVLARRINNHDGSFGGAVYGPIPSRKLNKAFSTLELGSKGVVALYHTDKQLAARFPALSGPNDPIGKVIINDQLREVMAAGIQES
jgi:hypothetical protein